MTSESPAAQTPFRTRSILLLLGSLGMMLLFIGTPPVQRTQEARVLETAREMLGKSWHVWLIPQLNGEPRLAKPPLAYWLAAGAFNVGGVSEGVGRVPFAFTGWLLLVLTSAIARRLFQSDRAAFFAGAVLLGSFMFARHARLAETDVLATCFVTASIGCILRGMEPDAPLAWLTLSGVALGLAILAKGIPAIFALLFLAAIAAAFQNWRLLWRWLVSGAPVLAIVIGLSWFLYAGTTLGWKTFKAEADDATLGREHMASAIQYIPQTLEAIAPWSALAIAGLVLAIPRWREDRRLRAMLVWISVIVLPLCIGGQKQYHYLFPLMPPLAIVTGWAVEQMLEQRTKESAMVTAILAGTMLVMLLGSFALPFVSHAFTNAIVPMDWMMLAMCAVGAAVPLALFLSKNVRQAAFAFAFAAAVCVTILVEKWMPSLRTVSPREAAGEVRAVGSGPYAFYGQNISLPMVFYLRQVAPRLITPDDLNAALATGREMIVIAQTKSAVAPPPVPPELELAKEIKTPDQTFEVYRVKR